MRIAVLANLKKNAPKFDRMTPDQWDDLDSPHTIDSIIEALGKGGHRAVFFEANINPPFCLIDRLREYRADLCFNIAEGHFGDSREAHIPSLLEMLEIPYTGSRVLTLALTLDKPVAKRILRYHGLPTPEFQVFESSEEPVNEDLLDEGGGLRFPVFVKPSREGTGMGISAESIVRDLSGLKAQVARLLQSYRQPVLCERYIQGREVTVGVLGNLRPKSARRLSDQTAPHILPSGLTFFPPLEVDMSAYDSSEAGVYTNRIKVELAQSFHYICPAPLEASQVDMLNRLAAAVFRVMGCYDVARVDFRLDESDENSPYILEVNPLPGLGPDYSDLPIEAYAAGWSYERLINTIVDLAATRFSLEPSQE
jgi:D-alanine-D-alanine ligase